jgi:sulfite exporter TauE/SafE
MAAAVCIGLLVAGFWNPRLVDGFGRNVVTGRTLGDSSTLGGSFAQNGFGFGFLFAAVAGLAATFTACNCVVFAMLPGLAATGTARSRRPALSALAVFATAVMLVGAVYGTFIGLLGPQGIEAFNSRAVRMAQARTIFSVIGLLMLGWGALEFGFLEPFRRRISPETRAFFTRPAVKAGLLGLLVGAFAIGRPFPVMRDFLVYAATANSPIYGAAVMMIQGLGQITVMVLLLVVLVYGFGGWLTRWVTSRPQQVALVTAVALVAGGTFFLYYWGLANAFNIGRWGFRLGWYS